MTRSIRVAAFTAALAAAPIVAFAHHGWSEYDATKPIKITAPLTNVTWSNPHGAAKVAYQGKSWTVVLAPVARMESRGLSRQILAAGTRVTLEGFPRKDGTAEMKIERVTVNGKVVELR